MSRSNFKVTVPIRLRAAARHPIGYLAGSVATTLALYGLALSLPVVHDDAVVMRAVSGASLWEILTTRVGLAYYRPASLGIWKLYELAVGPAAWPAALHAHNLILFALSGWLVGLLARRLAPEHAALPWLTMALFLCFPFSYQAVSWPSADVHLQVLAGTLGAIVLIDRWWQDGRISALILAWICLMLAVFSHENGVLAPLLMAGWLVNRAAANGLTSLGGQRRRLATALAPGVALALIYGITWMALPGGGGSQPVTLASIGWNLAYFSQGLLFPVAPLGGLVARTGIDPVISAWITAAAGLIGLGALARLSRMRAAWLGMAWYAAGVSVAAVALPSSYTVDGPRLMLLGSAGAALAWAGVVSGLWERLSGRRRILPALLAALCLAVGAGFVVTRMALHQRMAAVYEALIGDISPNTDSLVVNLPAWLAPDGRVFALGNEGVAYMADYYPLTELLWANTGATPQLRRMVAEDITPALAGYTIGMVGGDRQPSIPARIAALQQVSAVFVVTAQNNQWQVVEAQRAGSMPDGAAAFTDGIRVSAQAQVSADRATIVLRLTWEADQPASAIPFVHLMCGGQLAAQADGAPVQGLYPFDHWKPGERWQEDRIIALPATMPNLCHSVQIGLSDPTTGRRFKTQGGGEVVELALTAGQAK